MYISTVEILPNNLKFKELFSLIEGTYMIKLSEKGIFDNTPFSVVSNNAEAYEHFIKLAPKKADAIIGIRTTTTTATFSNGTYLYITYTGTPASMESVG